MPKKAEKKPARKAAPKKAEPATPTYPQWYRIAGRPCSYGVLLDPDRAVEIEHRDFEFVLDFGCRGQGKAMEVTRVYLSPAAFTALMSLGTQMLDELERK